MTEAEILAERFWRIHPRELDEMKMTRQEFYADEMTSLIDRERGDIIKEARRYAAFYPEGSDGRNTFVMFADWVEART